MWSPLPRFPRGIPAVLITVQTSILLSAADIPGEGYTFDIDQLEIAATDDGENMAFIGHVQNFVVDGVDVIGLLQRHASAAPADLNPPVSGGSAAVHSVRSNTGELTDRELPIPVNPVTLRAGPGLDVLRLPTLDLTHGNATLKMMFKTLVSSVQIAGAVLGKNIGGAGPSSFGGNNG